MTFYVVLVKIVPAAIEIHPGVACLLITLTSEQQGIYFYYQFPRLYIAWIVVNVGPILTVMLLKKNQRNNNKNPNSTWICKPLYFLFCIILIIESFRFQKTPRSSSPSFGLSLLCQLTHSTKCYVCLCPEHFQGWCSVMDTSLGSPFQPFLWRNSWCTTWTFPSAVWGCVFCPVAVRGGWLPPCYNQ